MVFKRLLFSTIGPAVLGLGFAVAASPDEGRARDRLIIGFDDDARVRLRGGRLVSLRGVDLWNVERVLGPYPIRTLFYRDEAEIEATRRRAEALSGRLLPDLNSYFEVSVEVESTDELIRQLLAFAPVATVYRPALPQAPPVDIPPPTPDGEADQIHLDPAPEGIDAEAAWTRPGGRGAGVLVVDIEYNWRDTHEDLDSALGRQLCFTPDSPEIEHGTAVIGELVAGDNGYGVTGIVSDAEIGLVTHSPQGMSYNVARAIDCATGLMEVGDVLLIEAQTFGPNGKFVPPEWDPAEYDAIVVAAAAGIVVVETAGNGNEDLDRPEFGGAFDRGVRDSGALIVGAGADLWYVDQPDRSRLEFSTYGSRVDLQGWGDDVVTTGYGDAFDGGGDPNQFYTELFNGTSSAAPMIAGAAAALQGVQLACGGPPLTAAWIRDVLVATGSPQVAGPFPGHIGPRPDLAAALAFVDVDDDTDGFAECEGDCDDGTPATYPGAPEVNDGLDNQCPGEPGHGSVDETSGISGFHHPTDETEYSWPAQGGATSYEVARSSSPEMSTGCQSWQTSATFINDAETPAPGGAYFYLNRPLAPFPGSWGQRSPGVERSGACL